MTTDQPDTRAMPNGTEQPGEHWNARLIREAADRIPAPRPVPTFADRLATDERDQLDARAATAEAERDEARDDRDAARRERNEWEQTAAQLGKQLDEMREARDVLRHRLDHYRAELGRAQKLIAELRNNRERDDRAFAAYDTRQVGERCSWPCTLPKGHPMECDADAPPVLGSSSARAQDLAARADRIAQAIGDPGSIVIRREGESVTRWSTRAVLLVLAEREG